MTDPTLQTADLLQAIASDVWLHNLSDKELEKRLINHHAPLLPEVTDD